MLTTEPGATSVELTVSPPGARHFVVVHAVDLDEREDANAVEKSAIAVGDTTPPRFEGLRAALPADDGARLAWAPAADDLTPPEGLRYAVFGGRTKVDFGAPLMVVEGATEARVARVGPAEAPWRFAVRALDAGGNFDTNARALATVLGADTSPPSFAGCARVAARGSRGLTVAWQAATDVGTPASGILYEVFAAPTSGGQPLARRPTAWTIGATSLVVTDLEPATEYHVICRARDEAGNRDDNVVEASARTTANVTPPSFAGITSHALDPALRTLRLAWAPATDDATPIEAIVYDVFQAEESGAYDPRVPAVTSTPGATTITLRDLPSNRTSYWTVRARDADHNHDGNTIEVQATTHVSFAEDIAPLLGKHCALAGCHASARPAGGLPLGAWAAYDALVGVPAAQRPPDWPGLPAPSMARVTPFEPEASYLLRKVEGVPATIAGARMPPPGTGTGLPASAVEQLARWIAQGAPKN